jgi:hypothetical protein
VTFTETVPLLADAEWMKVVFGAIVFIIYIIGQIMSAREEGKKKKARPRPVPRQPQGPQAGAPAGPPNQADPLRAEVEEFLRRVQGKPAQEEPIVLQADSPREQRSARQKQKERRTRSEAEQRRSPLAEPAPRRRLKPQPLEPINLREESVAGHVARHLSTQDIAEQTSHLGEEVSQADENMEAHLQETFSGQLGSLQHRELAVVDLGPTIAEEIRELISSPAGMRQMIVANEILRRPIDRW